MLLKELIVYEHSRAHTDFVAGIILQKPELFQELLNLMLTGESPIPWRAAWIIEKCSEQNPLLIKPYIPELIEALPNFKNDGIKRHITKILANSPLPSKKLGLLVNTCFDWLLSGEIPVAVKVHCMQILYNISQTEPDLKPELAAAIESQIIFNSAGFKSRGNKILHKLNNEIESL
ncbi:MAG: hypothetical protein K8R58_08025 [Bacteroidales bacterium]|nr:hypothetical protein [Bacteroidales bacterium]